MIEDMQARKMSVATQEFHIVNCRRFAAFLRRSPEIANWDDLRRFPHHLADTGANICKRNRTTTGMKFPVRVMLSHSDLAVVIHRIREPQMLRLVMSQEVVKRLLAIAKALKIWLLKLENS